MGFIVMVSAAIIGILLLVAGIKNIKKTGFGCSPSSSASLSSDSPSSLACPTDAIGHLV